MLVGNQPPAAPPALTLILCMTHRRIDDDADCKSESLDEVAVPRSFYVVQVTGAEAAPLTIACGGIGSQGRLHVEVSMVSR
jgi:hypothetical protein